MTTILGIGQKGHGEGFDIAVGLRKAQKVLKKGSKRGTPWNHATGSYLRKAEKRQNPGFLGIFKKRCFSYEDFIRKMKNHGPKTQNRKNDQKP